MILKFKKNQKTIVSHRNSLLKYQPNLKGRKNNES